METYEGETGRLESCAVVGCEQPATRLCTTCEADICEDHTVARARQYLCVLCAEEEEDACSLT